MAADIVLLIDRSSSIGRSGSVVESALRAGAFLDALDLGTQRVGVVSFDQHAIVAAPLGSDRVTLDRALASLRAAPGTRIERAIRLGLTELEATPSSAGRRRILALVTDGVQTGPDGRAVVQAAAGDAQALGVGIVSLALGPVPDLGLLASISTGAERVVASDVPDGLPSAYRALASAATCGR